MILKHFPLAFKFWASQQTLVYSGANERFVLATLSVIATSGLVLAGMGVGDRVCTFHFSSPRHFSAVAIVFVLCCMYVCGLLFIGAGLVSDVGRT